MSLKSAICNLSFAFLALGIIILPSNANAAGSNRPINYPALFKAIAQVESEHGATSKNVYQLTYAFIYDIERITGETLDYKRVTESKPLSERYMRIYWAYYTSRHFNKTGASVSPELLAKIHHVGYCGLKSKHTAANIYWRKVSKWYNLFSNKIIR